MRFSQGKFSMKEAPTAVVSEPLLGFALLGWRLALARVALCSASQRRYGDTQAVLRS